MACQDSFVQKTLHNFHILRTIRCRRVGKSYMSSILCTLSVLILSSTLGSRDSVPFHRKKTEAEKDAVEPLSKRLSLQVGLVCHPCIAFLLPHNRLPQTL